MVKKLTSIIILTWNALEYTRECLDYLSRFTPEPHEVIVIDNGSKDGTVDFLKTKKGIKCIFNSENRGFAAGVNQGIKIARGEYFLLLNNDVLVMPFWLRNLINCLEDHPARGLVGPRSNFAGGPQGKIKLPGKITPSVLLDFGYKFNRKTNPDKWFLLNTLSGFCLLLDREVIEKIGIFDERYKLGTREDRDFCLRAEKKGFEICCAGDTFVFHYGHSSFKANKIDWKEVQKKNKKLFYEKWGIEG